MVIFCLSDNYDLQRNAYPIHRKHYEIFQSKNVFTSQITIKFLKIWTPKTIAVIILKMNIVVINFISSFLFDVINNSLRFSQCYRYFTKCIGYNTNCVTLQTVLVLLGSQITCAPIQFALNLKETLIIS